MGKGPGFYRKDGTFSPGTSVKTIGGLPEKEAVEKILNWVGDVEKFLDILVPYIRVRGNQFLDQWLTQVLSAKSDASIPPEESTDHWFVALAGNLIWAATCFVPGAGIVSRAGQAGMSSLGKSFYATMSVGGAVVGSGTIQRLATDSSGAPSGKDVVATVLNKERKKLGAVFENNIENFALDMIKRFPPKTYSDDRNKFLKAVDMALWDSIFPTIRYEDYQAIYDQSLRSINLALGRFKTQFNLWNAHRVSYIRGDKLKYPPPWGSAPARDKEFRKKWPFKPHLDFREKSQRDEAR